MAMQLNPTPAFLRGMDLGSPSTSQGGINNLMMMQQQSVNDLANGLGNIGKISRTNAVNDLIARGGLEGLNENQAQQQILNTAGGTLTPEGQLQADKFLALTGKQDERNFRTDERLAGQQFNTSERLGGEQFTSSENKLREQGMNTRQKSQQDFQSGQTEKEIKAKESENKKERDFRMKLEKNKEDFERERLSIENKFKLGLISRQEAIQKSTDLQKENDKELKELYKIDPSSPMGQLMKMSSLDGKYAIQTYNKTGRLQVVENPAEYDKGGHKMNPSYTMYLDQKPISVNTLKNSMVKKK